MNTPNHGEPATPTPARRLDGLVAYRRSTLSRSDLLRLDGNEGAPPRAETVAARLGTISADTVGRYPDASVLERRLADRHGVEPEQVLVTAGADEALDRICRAYLEPGRNALLPSPTFEMIPRYIQLAGAEARTVEWAAGSFPVDAFCSRADANTALAFVVTPNNPTGAVAARSAVDAVVRALPTAFVVVDLAYVEFADDDPTADLLERPNVIVARTLSKAIGLAGLRVGYLLGPPAAIEDARRAASPFSVPGPSLALAAALLGDQRDAAATFVAAVRREREVLAERLRTGGFDVPAGQASFVLARSPDDGGKRAHAVADGLLEDGIAIRTFRGRPELEDAIRITCPGDDDAFARLLAALERALERTAPARGTT